MKVSFTFFRRVGATLAVAFLAITLVPVTLASSPEAGAKGKYRGQCRKLTVQIDHYEGTILPMAVNRGNRAWEKATNSQIERLWHRRADLCPAYGAERTMILRARDQMRKFNQLVAAAGRAAITYFTGGLSGGLMP